MDVGRTTLVSLFHVCDNKREQHDSMNQQSTIQSRPKIFQDTTVNLSAVIGTPVLRSRPHATAWFQRKLTSSFEAHVQSFSRASKVQTTTENIWTCNILHNLGPQMPHTRHACAVMPASATAANMPQAEPGRFNGPARLSSDTMLKG